MYDITYTYVPGIYGTQQTAVVDTWYALRTYNRSIPLGRDHVTTPQLVISY